MSDDNGTYEALIAEAWDMYRALGPADLHALMDTARSEVTRFELALDGLREELGDVPDGDDWTPPEVPPNAILARMGLYNERTTYWVFLQELKGARAKAEIIHNLKLRRLKQPSGEIPPWGVLDESERGELESLISGYRAIDHVMVANGVISQHPDLATFKEFSACAAEHKSARHHPGGRDRYGDAIVEALRNHLKWKGFAGFTKEVKRAYSKIPKSDLEIRKYLE